MAVVAFVTAECPRLASCSDDKTLRLWDPVNGGPPLSVLAGHRDYVLGLDAYTAETEASFPNDKWT